MFNSLSRNYLGFVLALFALFSGIVISIIGEIILLPDSGKDAVKFFNLAKKISDEGVFESSLFFQNLGSFNISKWFAMIIHIFGNSTLPITITGQIFKTILCLVLFYWSEPRVGKKAAFVVACLYSFSPTNLLYSSLPLRDCYVVFIGGIALLLLLDYEKLNSTRFFIGLILLISSAFLHPVYLFASIIFWIICHGPKKLFFRPNPIYWVVVVLALYTTINFQINISKIGDIDANVATLIFKRTLDYQSAGLKTGNHMPSFLMINSFGEMFYKPFLRAIFFILGPLNFSSSLSLLSTIQGFFYFGLLVYCFRKNPYSNWLIFILICSFTLGLVTTADGSLVRHRFKTEIFFFFLLVDTIYKRRLF